MRLLKQVSEQTLAYFARVAYLLFLFSVGTAIVARSGFAVELVEINKSAKNAAISITIDNYSLQKEKLGEKAPVGKIWFIISGLLTNLNSAKGASIPPVDKAFFLKLANNDITYLHPLSEDTVDPFWGELVLAAGETLPFEAIYLLDDQQHLQISLMHFSNKGPMNIYVVGEGPAVPEKLLSDSAQVGNALIGVERVRYLKNYQNQDAPKGKQYLSVDFWFTNMLELQPLDTYLPDLIVVEENNKHSYPPLAERRTPENLLSKTYYPLEPTAENLMFLIPDQSGYLQLVHITTSGPLKVNLTPDLPPPTVEKAIAGPVGERLLKLSLYKSGSKFIQAEQLLILDVGLQLNHTDTTASFRIRPMNHFELHYGSGNFSKPIASSFLERPLEETEIFKGIVTRGQIAFELKQAGGDLKLVIPFASGPTTLPIPELITSTDESKMEIEPQNVKQPQKPSPEKSAKPGLLSGDLFGNLTSPQKKPATQKTTAKVPTKKKIAPVAPVSPPNPTLAGFKRILAVERPGTARKIYVGNVPTQSILKKATKIIQQASNTENHIQIIPNGTTHPRTLRVHAQIDMNNAGLTKVQVRSRKKGELILVGSVSSTKDKKLASTIARLQPGITTVVNSLKIK